MSCFSVTVDLDSNIGTHGCATDTGNAHLSLSFIFLELGRVIPLLIQMLRSGYDLLGTYGEAKVTTFAKLSVNRDMPSNFSFYSHRVPIILLKVSHFQ